MAAVRNQFRQHLAPSLLESLLEQHRTRTQPLEIAAVRDGNGTLFILPAREHDLNDTSVVREGRNLISAYGPVQQGITCGFHSLSVDRFAPRALRRLAGTTPIGRHQLQVYAEPALLEVMRRDVEALGKSYPAQNAAVCHGAINVPNSDIGTYFPAADTTFTLEDRSGFGWATSVRSNKISRGITEFAARENARLAAEGKAPLTEGDALYFIRIGDHAYHLDVLKAVGAAAPVAPPSPANELHLPVLRTLIAYRCINVPLEHIDSYFPRELQTFELRDVHGQQWETHIASSKISTGVRDFFERENNRLNRTGGVRIGDDIVFRATGGRRLYTVEIEKAAVAAVR